MKRPASEVSVSGKRGRKANPNNQLFDDIIDCIKQAKVDAAVRAMVSQFVRPGLNLPKDVRHPYMERSLGMVGEVLNSVKKDLCGVVDALKVEVCGSGEKRKTLEEAVETAKVAAEEQSAKMLAVTETQTKANDDVVEARQVQKNAVDMKENVGMKIEKIRRSKTAVDDVFKNHYELLKESKKAKSVKVVVKMANEVGMYSNLVSAIALTLARAPAERTPFDAVVTEHFDEALKDTIQKMESDLNEAIALEIKLAAELDQENDRLLAAEEKLKTCKSETSAIKVTLGEGRAAVSAAVASLKSFGPAVKRNESGLVNAQNDVERIEKIIADFVQLRDKTSELESPGTVGENEAEDDPEGWVQFQQSLTKR